MKKMEQLNNEIGDFKQKQSAVDDEVTRLDSYMDGLRHDRQMQENKIQQLETLAKKGPTEWVSVFICE